MFTFPIWWITTQFENGPIFKPFHRFVMELNELGRPEIKLKKSLSKQSLLDNCSEIDWRKKNLKKCIPIGFPKCQLNLDVARSQHDHVCFQTIYKLLTDLMMLFALIPYRSNKASPGPLRGMRGTANMRTVIPVSSATAAATVSPIPPGERKKENIQCFYPRDVRTQSTIS